MTIQASIKSITALALILAAGAASAGDIADPRPGKTESGKAQYVLISFDGAHDNAQWERSLKLADETGARFTYFLSCVFLLSPQDKALYKPPGMKAGRSNVGFAPSREDATARLGHVWAAYRSGHEIASHGCGHFDGKAWSKADWSAEFTAFADILRRGWEINGLQAPEGWDEFARNAIRGFRAPYLSTSPGLNGALKAAGFSYSASDVTHGPQLPKRDDGFAEFGLPMIPEGPRSRRIIAMDYNLFVRHSGGIERPGGAPEFTERAYAAFAAAFDAEYSGERKPLQIGFHFTLMNGGAYWAALERFARTYCTKADVRCVTYSDWLKANPPADTVAGG